MAEDEFDPGPPPAVPPDEAVDRLAASARGWHTIQVGVLGFIGICGVLRTADTAVPHWVQQTALGFAVAAFAVACLAIFLVGQVAYPLGGGGTAPGARRRLRAGIRLTILALALIVIAALSGWWPRSAAPTAAAVDGSHCAAARAACDGMADAMASERS